MFSFLRRPKKDANLEEKPGSQPVAADAELITTIHWRRNLRFIREHCETTTAALYLCSNPHNNEILMVKESIGIGSQYDMISNEYTLLFKYFLKTPYIVPFRGGCIAGDVQFPYLVTSYLAGGSLADKIQHQAQFTWTVSIQILKNVAMGIAAIHEKNIVHRDIKSANIFLDSSNHAYVGDLALARKYNRENAYQSPNPQVTGTDGWIAPESYKNLIYYDKSDWYSFGVVIWEIAAGEKPLSSKSIAKKIEATLSGQHDKIPDNTPAGIAKLIRWCWQQEPSARPTKTQILTSLDECLAEIKSPSLK